MDIDDLFETKQDASSEDRAQRRMLSEKQRDALKLGRERRWFRKQEEGEQNPPVQQQHQTEKPSHPFFNVESSESSSEEEPDEEGNYHPSSSKKPQIPSAIKRRVDRYIQQKLNESMTGMTMGGPPSTYPSPSPPFRFQYL